MSTPSVATPKKSKIATILVSQPAPESPKSPYYDLAKRYKLRIDFRPFIEINGVTLKEFRKSRVSLNDFSGIIFTSRNAIDHVFRLCDELRIKLSQETKYFCISEAIALYLQKYIQYRKRKVFFANGTLKELKKLLLKYKDSERILYPCSEVRKDAIPKFLRDNEFNSQEAVVCKTVSSDLSDLKNLKYDMIVFFSPSGVKSLYDNFPKFKQNTTKIAAFGPATRKAVESKGLKLDVGAPIPQAHSMAVAIEYYLKSLK